MNCFNCQQYFENIFENIFQWKDNLFLW
jgi:hypothetical protein